MATSEMSVFEIHAPAQKWGPAPNDIDLATSRSNLNSSGFSKISSSRLAESKH